MPLQQGSSRKVIGENIAELERAGHKPSQAAAIAYKEAGEDEGSILDLTIDTQSARTEDINGWAEIKGNPISKVGVFPYSGQQISSELEPDRIYQVYRPEEELNDPETIESFKLIPWVDEHAMLGSDEGLTPAERKGIQGVIGEDVYFEDGYLKANLKIFSNKLAELIDSGKKELSIGYRCIYDIVSGVYNGVRYDAVQRQIRGNHVALVDEGRSGPDVAVLDHFKFTFDTKGLVMADEIREEETAADEGEMSLAECFKMLKELRDEMSAMKAKDEAEPEEEKSEDEADPAMFVEKAKLNEDESEEEKAEDESEEEKAEDEDMEKPEDSKGMDSMKNVFKEIAARDALAKRLQPHIGVFDHKEKTLSEVAGYAVKRLGVPCQKGHEHAAIEGYLRGARVSVAAVGQDSAVKSSCIDKYLAGGE